MSEELEIQNVNGSEWDYLIVLDACRYDYFEKHYSDFLEGDLEKKRSKGTTTPEWLPKTFTSRYNYKYIASNPYVNSMNIPIKINPKYEDSEWNPTQTFTEVIDAWDLDWSEEHHTVHPEDLTDRAIKEAEEEGKTIIHYLPPHRPYISCPVEEKNIKRNEIVKKKAEGKEIEENPSLKRKMIEATRPIWNKFFWKLPYRIRWKIKELFRLENPHWGALVTEVGEQKVREYYQKDLRIALKQVARFTEQVDGKIVVTADHGESLGEHNDWGHQRNSNNPYMYTVPWLEVKGAKK